MRTPPANLPSIPEGWVYIGADDGSLVIEGCEDDQIGGVKEGDHTTWCTETPDPANRWSLCGNSPNWHFIAKTGSKIARLNGADEPTHKPLLVSAEKYALLMKENEHLTRENERLKQQIESRNQLVVGFKDFINRVMEFGIMIKPCPHCQTFNHTERRECRRCFRRLDGTPSVPASRILTRKAFICKYCDCVYSDDPVSQCDCLGMYYPCGKEKPGSHFIEGMIAYTPSDQATS